MPSRSTLTVIVLLFFLAVVTGWNYLAKPFSDRGAMVEVSPTPVTEVSSQNPNESAVLAGLTTEQKVATLIAFPLTVSASASPSAVYQAELDWVGQYQPGAVTIFGSNVSQTRLAAIRQDLQTLYPVTDSQHQPLLVVDHEGGQVQRLNGAGFTRLPSWRSLCSQSATQSAALLQTSLTELQEAGVDLVLSPMVDVASSHAVLRDRVCSDDPELVVERALNYIEIAESVGIKPVIKHFPGIGKTTQDLHRAFDRVSITPEDALIFKYVLEKYPELGVMVSPVGVNNQYPNLPCTLSLDCVKELASNFPQVLIVSDGLDMAASRYNEDGELLAVSAAAVKAVKAGNQLLVFGPELTLVDLTDTIKSLVTAYETDPDVKAAVDRGATKVIQLQQSQI